MNWVTSLCLIVCISLSYYTGSQELKNELFAYKYQDHAYVDFFFHYRRLVMVSDILFKLEDQTLP